MNNDYDRELSDLSLSRVECKKCGAVWINGQHVWSGTGQKGNEKSLSNLVCSMVDDPDCANPSYKKGHIYGEADSWEKRNKFIEKEFGGMDQ